MVTDGTAESRSRRNPKFPFRVRPVTRGEQPLHHASRFRRCLDEVPVCHGNKVTRAIIGGKRLVYLSSHWLTNGHCIIGLSVYLQQRIIRIQTGRRAALRDRSLNLLPGDL